MSHHPNAIARYDVTTEARRAAARRGVYTEAYQHHTYDELQEAMLEARAAGLRLITAINEADTDNDTPLLLALAAAYEATTDIAIRTWNGQI